MTPEKCRVPGSTVRWLEFQVRKLQAVIDEARAELVIAERALAAAKGNK